MLINKNLSRELYEDAGEEKIKKAKEYVKKGNVNIIESDYEDMNNFDVVAKVLGKSNEKYKVHIYIKNAELESISCTCFDYSKNYHTCKHIIATLLRYEQTKFWDKEYEAKIKRDETKGMRLNEARYRGFKNIVTQFYNDEIEKINKDDFINKAKEKVKIDTKIIYDKFSGNIKLEFKIGNKRMYKIKDLSEFYTRMSNHEYYKYGEKLEFLHIKENFEEESRELLDFIMKYSEVLKCTSNVYKHNYYGNTITQSEMILGESMIDEAFEILKNKKVAFEKDFLSGNINFIEGNPKIEFTLSKENEDEFKIEPNVDLYNLVFIKGKNNLYILKDFDLYKCDSNFKHTTLKLIKAFKNIYSNEVYLRKEDLQELYSIIIPKIGKSIKISGFEERDIEDYIPKKLNVKVYLDFDNNDYIVADTRFIYDEIEFNPLDEHISQEIKRNMMEENKALNIFRRTGFMLDKRNSRFILPDDEKIYEFLSNDIKEYMEKFEILVTDRFKTKEIRQPKIGAIGVKVENDLLSIDLNKLNIDISELKEIMEKYQLKKKYHRLKDGSFVSLEENQDMEFLDKLANGMDINYKNVYNNDIKLPVNRTLYLNELLKNVPNLKITKNDKYKEIVNDLQIDNTEEVIAPKGFENILRDYQKTGYKWLKNLDNYNLGGILADDMGLGKTIQMLSLIVDYVENKKENKKTSLVVSPSSLALNWFKESEKYANNLKTLVIHGNANERKESLSKIENYNLIITSYDLLKRDIELYKEKNYIFKYIIADEAQYLKNSNTQNAKAIKELKAETRFALTGTPIENSLSELWSIFDFIMPGYLFTYKKFKNLYEIPIVKDNDKKAMTKLKMLISPFILRRTKKEVLTELPDKTITILENTMQEEQEKIYMTYLSQIKKEISDEIDINGFEKSQIKILAALTRLRQICCHPSLFIDGYTGGSSKLNQCIEIVEDAVNAGHKILLFSGYTSMFNIIEKELKKKNIKYYKLIGATKVDSRVEMVEDFNVDESIKVFLISLKAGGTGLNLIGADMVIHYDPWWNQSTENQATDRAYRIGQKNNVQVYKLITNNSIEEKIYELQQKKSELIDNVLDNQTSFISKFTKEEIMSLFN